MRLPITNTNRGSADCSIGRHAPFDCRGVDEWFETRAGLSISLDGVIEFIGVEVVTANHRDDLAGFGIHGHHRALHCGYLRQFNLQATILFVDFLDLKLGKITILELIFRLALSPTHVSRGHSRSEITK